MFTLALAACNGASNAAVDRLGHDGNRGFMVKTLQRGFWTRKYGLFVPLSYHPGTTQKYPVIIFLHGIGEGDGLGEGDLKNMTVGIGPAIARKANKFEFIVIFPQSDGGWAPGSDYTEDLFTALANTCREYPVDSDRIALTGLSTGGAGTWAIGAKYNDQFSALVPMGSNGSDQGDAPRLTHVAVRAYCSMFGDIFAGWNDQGMVNRIKSLNPSANAQFISTPTLGHDCWENVYGGDDIYEWLKKQHRSTALASSVTTAPPLAQAPAAMPAIQAPSPAPPPRVTTGTPLVPIQPLGASTSVRSSAGMHAPPPAGVNTPW